MRLLLVESFFGGSHKVWVDNVQKIFGDQMDIITLPDRFWKWRMEGGAWALAQQYKKKQTDYEVILISDLINLSLFLSLAEVDRSQTKIFLYMHENQITYPWPEKDSDQELGRDRHYGFMNIMNAIVADRLFFNSVFHRLVFAKAVPPFLNLFPDAKIEFSQKDLMNKSEVLSIPLELKKLVEKPKVTNQVKVILWNHRWEYDKNPELFFKTLMTLKAKGFDFKLNVIGQNYKRSPEIFEIAKDHFSKEIVHFGFIKSKSEYFDILSQSDLLPVCSNHDFFGISIVEAIASGCIPLLPNRLVYPDHLDVIEYKDLFYDTEEAFQDKLANQLNSIKPVSNLANQMLKYDIDSLKIAYQEKILNS